MPFMDSGRAMIGSVCLSSSYDDYKTGNTTDFGVGINARRRRFRCFIIIEASSFFLFCANWYMKYDYRR